MKRNIKAIEYLSLTALLFGLFYFNIHWLISDPNSRVKFYLTSTAFEFLILGALAYQYSKIIRSRLAKATSCLFLIYALGNYLDEIWGKATVLGINEIVYGIIGLLIVVARFYHEWIDFIMNKIVPILFLCILVYLLCKDKYLTAIIIAIITIVYVIWTLMYKQRSNKG